MIAIGLAFSRFPKRYYLLTSYVRATFKHSIKCVGIQMTAFPRLSIMPLNLSPHKEFMEFFEIVKNESY